MGELIGQVLSHFGLPGAFIGWLIWQLQKKDAECKAERAEKDKAIAAESAARIADARASTDLMLRLQEKIHTTIDRLAEYAERIEKERTR